MRKILLLVPIVFYALVLNPSCTRNNSKDSNTETSNNPFYELNVKRCQKLSNEMLLCIAYIEDFSSTTYHCGAKWTIGYGSTISPNGARVTPKTPAITKETAKQWVFSHLEKHVYPFLIYVTRKLSDEELIGVCLFIYNVGGEQFSGYSATGKKRGNESGFLTSLNAGDDSYSVAVKMTGFRASQGKRANGLLKRHWVTGAIMCKHLKPADLLDLEPAGFYVTKNMGNYYWLNSKRRAIVKDGYWQLNYSEDIIKVFINMNTTTKKTRDIMDSRVQKYFKR